MNKKQKQKKNKKKIKEQELMKSTRYLSLAFVIKHILNNGYGGLAPGYQS